MGDNLTQALQNLLSRYAVDIEVENTDDIEGIIDAIIKANQNLTESNKNNDWEMMGSDIARLQELINSLEEAKEEEDKKQEEQEAQTENNVNNVVNEINSTTNMNYNNSSNNSVVSNRNTQNNVVKDNTAD